MIVQSSQIQAHSELDLHPFVPFVLFYIQQQHVLVLRRDLKLTPFVEASWNDIIRTIRSPTGPIRIHSFLPRFSLSSVHLGHI